MPTKKPLSEAAQWFLEDLQKILNDFSYESGIQVVVTDREGNLVSEVEGVQRACKLILATEEGRIRCQDHFKMPSSLFKTKKEPIFVECYAGFASLWMPIVVRGSVIGAIIGCGKRYASKGGDLRKVLSKLAAELGIMDKEDFMKAATDEVVLVTKEEMEKRIKRIKELFNILSTTAFTPLKEVFG
jgi:ligand-binding sensor protein